MSAASPSSSCSYPRPAGSWCTAPHTERSSKCCGPDCSPAQPTEPETGCSCRLYVISPAWIVSARRSNTAPGGRWAYSYFDMFDWQPVWLQHFWFNPLEQLQGLSRKTSCRSSYILILTKYVREVLWREAVQGFINKEQHYVINSKTNQLTQRSENRCDVIKFVLSW